MSGFRKINPLETSEKLLRRSSRRNRPHRETRDHSLPYVIRNARINNTPAQQSESHHSGFRYFDYNWNHQQLGYGRSPDYDYSSHNFPSPLNRNDSASFRHNYRDSTRWQSSSTTSSSSNHSFTPATSRVATSTQHGRYFTYPTSTQSRSVHLTTSISTDPGNGNWILPPSSQAGSANWIAPSSTRSENVNWIASSSRQSESTSAELENITWASPASTQYENANRDSSTFSEVLPSSAEIYAVSENQWRENHDELQNEDVSLWIEDRNSSTESTETRSRKSQKKPTRNTISSSISCPVCLRNYDEINFCGEHFVSGKCGHVICSVCIKTLLDYRNNCPRCRDKLHRRDILRLYI